MGEMNPPPFSDTEYATARDDERDVLAERVVIIEADVTKLIRQMQLLAIAVADATKRINEFSTAIPIWTPEEQDEIANMFEVKW